MAFETKTDYSTGGSPYDVKLVDVNGDNRLDIVSANIGSQTVAIQFGQADGSLANPVSYEVGTSPFSVAVQDVNGDNRLDLVTANLDGNSVSVLFGQTGGTFGGRGDYDVGPSPYAVAAADVNGDNLIDIVAANSQSNTVSILFGQGAEAFRGRENFIVGEGPTGLALMDVDGDDLIDIITANGSDSTVSVRLGQVGGTFSNKVDYAVGANPNSIAVADVDGDGQLDIVTPNINGGNVTVLLGQGDGTFADRAEYATGGVGSPSSVALGDVNGDNIIDIVTANSNFDGSVSVLLGQGDGTFTLSETLAVGAGPNAVALGDVNGDSRTDIVTGGAFGISVVLAETTTYAVTASPASATEGDTGSGNALTYTVTRTGDTSQAGSVAVNFSGSATFGTDYTSTVGNGDIVSFLANETTRTFTVTTSPDATLEPDETVIATISNVDGGGLIGADASATGTIANDEPLPLYAIAVSPGSVMEGNTGSGNELTYTVTRSGDTSQAGSVAVNFSGTATFGTDYTSTVGNGDTISFLAGETSKTFTVTTSPDIRFEGDEEVIVEISNGQGIALIGANAVATGTIIEDDQPPLYTIAVSPSSAVEGDAGPGNALTYTVTRTGDTSQAGSVAVDFTGTATFGTDYTSTVENGDRISFLANETSKTFTVTTAPDTTTERDESVIAEIYSVQGGGVIGADSTATGSIANDDPGSLYELTVSPGEVFEGDTGPGNTMTYTVTRSGDVSQAGSVTVNFSGRATFGSDYTSTVANGETISFLANETSKSFTVTTTPDLEIERTEAVRATISNVQGGGSIIQALATGFIANDDQLTRFAIAVSPASTAEGNTGSGNTLIYTVTRSGDTSEEGYAFVSFSGTATYGTDYTVANLGEFGEIIFQPGETTKTLVITTTPDTIIEPSETVIATIINYNPDETSSSSSATGTITNDDGLAPPSGGGGGMPAPNPEPIVGTDGPDTLTGGVSADILQGGLGNDTVTGLQGSDVLSGNQGSDTLFGNEGNDTLYGGKDDDSVYGGKDDDTLEGNLGNDVVFGGMGKDAVNGNQGNDLVLGNQGSDTVHGGQGDDLAHGGQGDDFVFGDLGNDEIWGDRGNDTLTGGAGADTFRFAANSGTDIIADFNEAEGDRLDFQGQSFTLRDVNGSAVFELSGGGTIVLQGVDPTSLGDFLIA
ncbi:FG-GAP-like repeat-containing protein [Aureimonas phyllosphaerae]|uniref:Ca2+-binding RTX toxin-like protein n=1 Tax=Aureimonas phyllosphaerae TaxID=1166078 RepID=A0A7W6C1W8_9HYPH|nr:FG-GAP-like repeat-containing protein [Aureimonas phyllosphaerae]MBB3937976.1 Ca2+-binding RTX toxin-like protein [Aureimonas phyllosphaerae]MBB3961979.1 Ca2+-binding RTX toxin-like protein [Aureimonas phyllosphaerae]SFF52801.1 Ca2+-binding protein, RTX toxin-related [Aureimonas phyllosphaerae]